MPNFIIRGVKGQEKLWKVFWIYLVLIGLLLDLFLDSLGSFLGESMAITIMTATISLLYNLWALIATWKCAFNTDWRGWGHIVRIVIVLSILLRIVLPFAMYFLVQEGRRMEDELNRVGNELGKPASEITTPFDNNILNEVAPEVHEAPADSISEPVESGSKDTTSGDEKAAK